MASKKAKKEEPKQEVTLEMLQAAAADFNSFMFTDPEDGIDLDLEFDDLLAEVTETTDELEATDTIQKETAETLNTLGLETVAGIADFDEPGEDDKVSEVEPEEDETEKIDEMDAAKAADLALVKKTKDVEKMKNVAKAWGVRIPPLFYKDMGKLRAYLIGKLDGSADASPAKEKKEKPVKTEKVEKPAKDTAFGINDFFESVIPTGLGTQHEDEIVLLAKEKFPDKPYRVIGNALYSYCRKFVK